MYKEIELLRQELKTNSAEREEKDEKIIIKSGKMVIKWYL